MRGARLFFSTPSTLPIPIPLAQQMVPTSGPEKKVNIFTIFENHSMDMRILPLVKNIPSTYYSVEPIFLDKISSVKAVLKHFK